MPLGVDSTSCLVEAQLRDRAASAAVAGAPGAAPSFAGSSESELRLQYAMAVVRMVNGIADSAQRGRIAASVASLAAAAGALTGGRWAGEAAVAAWGDAAGSPLARCVVPHVPCPLLTRGTLRSAPRLHRAPGGRSPP